MRGLGHGEPMSARPDWLTDEMMAEMRRLKGTCAGNRMPMTEAFWSISRGTPANTSWVNAHLPCDDLTCWLTESGHKALAAIEAEAAGKTTPPPEKYIYKVVTGTSAAVRMLNPAWMEAQAAPRSHGNCLDGECDWCNEAEPATDSTPATKPCPNCDHGNGPSGVSFFGMRCSVCNGSKVVR